MFKLRYKTLLRDGNRCISSWQLYAIIFATIYLAENVKAGAILMPYGPQEGDQVLSSQSSDVSAATTLPQPFTFFEKQHTELYISENGAISLSGPISSSSFESIGLDAEKRDIIAIFYAPTKGGTIYYRTGHDGSPLSREISAKIRRAFFSEVEVFEAQSVVLVTWENVRSTDENQATLANTYQIALATNSKSSYAIFLYGKLEWSSIKSADGQIKYAQSGFYSNDGRSEKLINSGTPNVSSLTGITNFNENGLFLFRVSGSHPIDPRHAGGSSDPDNDEYEYPTDQEEYDPDAPIAECPNDPYRDHCPAHCNIITDDRDCTLCVCSNIVSEHNGHPSYAKVSPNDIEPVVDDRSAINLDSQNDLTNDLANNKVNSQEASTRTDDLRCNPSAHNQCHANASCVQFGQSGYCCDCQPSQYGNGVECLPKNGPLRINGVFEGAINGKSIERTDIFAYIQIQDGQQHTALARIPQESGWSLALLDSIGNGIGWMFAKPYESSVENVLNGFQLTGGAFNRTVTIHLGDRYAIVVKQQFTDRHLSDNFAVNMFVSGTLPEFSVDKKPTIEFPPFEETYRREGPGIIRSYNERHILIGEEGGEKKRYQVTTDQQIHYKECPGKVRAETNVQVFRYDRISAQYHTEQGIVRFASQAWAGSQPNKPYTNGNAVNEQPITNIDPCSPGSHYCTEPNMVCRPNQHTYRCECLPGYRFERDSAVDAGFRCVVLSSDPQSSGTALDTLNEQGRTFTSCSTHQQCHQWGECVFASVEAQQKRQGFCKCRGWYKGDGVNHCGPPEETVYPLPVDNAHQQQTTTTTTKRCGEYICDTNADCIGDTEETKNCVCHIGWHGNGIRCTTNGNQQSYQQQWDRARNSYQHSPSVNVGTICREDKECGLNAKCVYSAQMNSYQCQCLPSYIGNGIECTREVSVSSEPSCESKLSCHPHAHCVHNGSQPICQCLEGYMGDGLSCVLGTPIVQPAVDHDFGGGQEKVSSEDQKQCEDQKDCHINGHCVWLENIEKYYCQCLPGFEGDGMHSCVQAEECIPSEVGVCGLNAKCLFSTPNHKFTCQCDQGFTRANNVCVELPPPVLHETGTNSVCSRCALEAKCQKSPSNGEWECVCMSGYVGNGLECQREPSIQPNKPNCLDDRNLCSVNAQCVPNERNEYVCNCNYGYRGNGHVCEPHGVSHEPDEEATLLIGRGMSIVQRSTNMDIPGKQLVVVPHQVVVDIAFDCKSQRIFWSDISGHAIRSVSQNGTGINSTLSAELRSPEGLAIDWSSRNFYYVDSIKNELGVATLDGKYKKSLLTEGLWNPRALVIDITNRHLYYSDWHRESPRIGRIDLDGSNHRTFVSENIHLPNGLTLLHGRQELCWVDAGSQRLVCIGLNGSGRRDVYKSLEYPFGLTSHQERRFYWTDWKDHKIHSVSVYGDGYTSFLPGAGGKSKLYGIISLNLKCNGAPTQCSRNNGGCDYICLPSTQSSGVVCRCPDNVQGLEGCP